MNKHLIKYIDNIRRLFSKSYIVVLALVWICLSLCGVAYIEKNTVYTVESQYESIEWEDYVMELHDLEFGGESDGEFIVIGADPYIVFDFTSLENNGAYGFVCRLKDLVDSSSIYYTDASMIFSEQKKIDFSKVDDIEFSNGSLIAYCRLDVDEAEGESFTVSDILVYKDYVLDRRTNAFRIIAMLFINVAVTLIAGFLFLDGSFDIFKKPAWIKSILMLGAFFLCSVVIGYATERVIAKLMGQLWNPKRMCIIAAGVFVIAVTVLFRKCIWEKFHWYFWIVALTLGLVNILMAPPTDSATWDSDSHYGRVLYILNGYSDEISPAERFPLMMYANGMDAYSREGDAATKALLDRYVAECSDGRSLFGNVDHMGLEAYAYYPAVIGLLAGEALHLPFYISFALGKFMFLLTYVSIMAFAIYKLPRHGKTLVAVIGLLPTLLYMASQYSYDWIVVAFAVLGYAEFIRLIQREGKISNLEMIRVCAFFALALIPKAIYMPMLLPLLLLKNDKYEHPVAARLIVIATILFLCATFVFPLLFGSFESDSRGGDNVDAMGQLQYVLHHPLIYIKILLRSMGVYLSLDNATYYTVGLGYFGAIKGQVATMIMLAVAAFVDGMHYQSKREFSVITRVLTVVVMLGTMALAMTSMYLAFTPIGLDQINGFQPRYMLPIMFPALLYLMQNRFERNDKSVAHLSVGMVLALAFIFLNGMMMMAVRFV